MLDEMNLVHFDFFAKCKRIFPSINFLNLVSCDKEPGSGKRNY